jgi:hypothetical protein
MTAPPETDVARIRKYCGARVPADLRHQVRVEPVVRGCSVTIYECRPPRQPNLTEWSKVRVAQLRYNANTRRWSLYWADRNGRWHRYDDLDPGRVNELLDEIDADPTSIFWGWPTPSGGGNSSLAMAVQVMPTRGRRGPIVPGTRRHTGR